MEGTQPPLLACVSAIQAILGKMVFAPFVLPANTRPGMEMQVAKIAPPIRTRRGDHLELKCVAATLEPQLKMTCLANCVRLESTRAQTAVMLALIAQKAQRQTRAA